MPAPRDKISDALQDFAKPLFDFLPPQAGPEDLERLFGIALLVWNAVVLEELGKPSPYMQEARKVLRASMGEVEYQAMSLLLSDMESRKRSEVPMDLRLIGDIGLFTDEHGVLRLRASATARPRDAGVEIHEP